MLYYLFQYLEETFRFPGASLFQYISFRAALAIILSLTVSILIGGKIIKLLQRTQVQESVRDLGLEGQMEKAGTPTMGGLIIIAAIVVPCVLIGKLHNIYLIILLIATIWMGVIGFIDDYIKVFKKDKKGLSGRFKVLGQIVLGLIVGITMLAHNKVVVRMDYAEAQAKGYEIQRVFTPEDPTIEPYVHVKRALTNVPFIRANRFDYASVLAFLGDNANAFVGFLFVPLAVFIVTAVSNAANLTDGLDGLATGVSAIIGGTLGVLAYVSGNLVIADYLNILYIPHSSELVIFSACFIGACVGFLWYNAYPAKVFMGDTGSLTLGGIIAAMAILLRKELLIPVLCGIFLMENAA